MALKFTWHVSGGFSGGLLPVLPYRRQKRAEGVSGGTRNGCYGKSGGFDVPAVVYRREWK